MIPDLRLRYGIREGSRVLDIGCGGRPFPLATHLADRSIDDASQRFGVAIPILSRPLIACSVEDLPFRAGVFDFVYCSHVLEHVRNPGAACRELMRVGRAGYIETPRSWVEYAFHSPDHRWLVDHEENVLIFREKLDEERRDHLGIQYAIFEWLRQPEFMIYWNSPRVRAVRNVEFHWRDGFDFRVIPRSRRMAGGRRIPRRRGNGRRLRLDRPNLREFLVSEWERTLQP